LRNSTCYRSKQDILVVAGRTKRHITLEEDVAKRLFSLRNSHAITREWVRTGALQGIITDGNGSTVYNLNNVFGIVPTVIDFVLDMKTWPFGTVSVHIRHGCRRANTPPLPKNPELRRDRRGGRGWLRI
jgi:hypothetical protein